MKLRLMGIRVVRPRPAPFRIRWKRVGWWIGGVLGFTILLIYAIPLPAGMDPPFSRRVRFRDGSLMRVFITPDERWRIRTPLEEMDPKLAAATVCFEDRHFWRHPGVNPVSMARALAQNVRAGRVLSGGSTLTMQLARIAEPKPRTLGAKLWEMARAAQFELRLGKRRILEDYLNLAPYGGNYEGVGAAALAYFHKPPKDLSAEEIAYLVSLPQSPTVRRPRANAPTLATPARNRVLSRMKECGLVTDAEYAAALNAGVPTRVRGFWASALHAADYVRAHYPEDPEAVTTLDPKAQRIAESIATAYAVRLRELGAHNASVVVMDNNERQVRALVGSLDYWDESDAGQVAGFDASRSPGSALKPFLYALALQNGVITTQTLLEDVPASHGGFRPENFSGTYRGMVPAEFALTYSLNAPFVNLLQKTGYGAFINTLDAGGLRYRKDLDYGLSAVTGGLEVRLLDLTNLYVTLARGGRHGPARFLAGDSLGEKPLFDPGAVSLTLRALSVRDRPDAPSIRKVAEPKATVYWKTGTSWGRRDAWSIGFTPDYTVGVWVGNFSGKGAEGIVGAEAAAPIMFDILRALGSRTLEIPEASDYLTPVKVCADTGYPATEYCLQTSTILAVKDHVPSRPDPYHQPFFVEARTGARACPWKTYGADELVTRVYTVFPPNAVAFMGTNVAPPPAMAPDCAVGASTARLRLVTPTDGASYLLTTGVRHSGRVPLQAWSDRPDRAIYWFVNGRYLTSTASGQVYYLEPAPGALKIVATDAAGNTTRAAITVQSP